VAQSVLDACRRPGSLRDVRYSWLHRRGADGRDLRVGPAGEQDHRCLAGWLRHDVQ